LKIIILAIFYWEAVEKCLRGDRCMAETGEKAELTASK
jgi:hypothetical protein